MEQRVVVLIFGALAMMLAPSEVTGGVVDKPTLTLAPDSTNNKYDVGINVTFTCVKGAGSNVAPDKFNYTINGVEETPTSPLGSIQKTMVASLNSKTATCSGEQGGGTPVASDPASLIVTAVLVPTIESSPVATGNPKELTVDRGKNVVFTCKENTASHQNATQFKFYEKPASGTSSEVTVGVSGATLTIVADADDENKEFSCEHYNDDTADGRKKSTVNINITTVNLVPFKPTLTGPKSNMIKVGEKLELTCTKNATDTTATGYRWNKGTAAISGATAANYTKANAQKTDSGEYTCEVINAAGTSPVSEKLIIKVEDAAATYFISIISMVALLLLGQMAKE